MTKKRGDRNSTKNMYTQLQRNFHQPLQPKRLLIVDVTQNQQIPLNWKGVPSDIKTLISYNARDNGITRNSFQIEHGQHMTANRFMASQTISMPYPTRPKGRNEAACRFERKDNLILFLFLDFFTWFRN